MQSYTGICKQCERSFTSMKRSQKHCSVDCGYQSRQITETHFWQKVDKGPHPNDCWLWTGHYDKDGYGKIGHKGVRTHRYIFELMAGPIPKGQVIRHSCDNPPCVNPFHLLAGTALDNKHDAIERQRIFHPVGDLCPSAKLTWETVREIRSWYFGGEVSQTTLAKAYGVNQANISMIVQGKTWVEDAPIETHADTAFPRRVFSQKGENAPSGKLTWKYVREIRAAYRPGVVTYRVLAEEYCVTPGAVAAIIQGRTWQEVA